MVKLHISLSNLDLRFLNSKVKKTNEKLLNYLYAPEKPDSLDVGT